MPNLLCVAPTVHQLPSPAARLEVNKRKIRYYCKKKEKR
jgi:hypothetical protein